LMSTSQLAAQEAPTSSAKQPLDFEFFKTRVEPIFLKKRATHVRCYFCHVIEPGAILGGQLGAQSSFRLQKLSPGSTFWTEEQSRSNFDVVSRLVVPGEPESSRLLLHPLAPDASGQCCHGGGRQFESKNDPDWLTLVEWVRGKKAGGAVEK
jgi:hypothetical protein